MSLRSTAQPLYTSFPIIFSSCFPKVTIGYYPRCAQSTALKYSVEETKQELAATTQRAAELERDNEQLALQVRELQQLVAEELGSVSSEDSALEGAAVCGGSLCKVLC